MRAVVFAALLLGCGGAPRGTEMEPELAAALRHDAALQLACNQPLEIELATFELEEVCTSDPSGDDETDAIAALAAECTHRSIRHVPLQTEDVWYVQGCGREIVLVCVPGCDSRPMCIEPARVGHFECSTYERG